MRATLLTQKGLLDPENRRQSIRTIEPHVFPLSLGRVSPSTPTTSQTVTPELEHSLTRLRGDLTSKDPSRAV